MGTTDNFDSPAKGSIVAGDQIPIKDSVTGRAAYALHSDLNTAGQLKGVDVQLASTVSNVNYGLMTLTSAHLAGATYPMSAPTAGVEKTISALIVSTAARVISGVASGSFFGATTTNLLTSTGVQTIRLIGLSTTMWGIVANTAAGATTSTITITT